MGRSISSCKEIRRGGHHRGTHPAPIGGAAPPAAPYLLGVEAGGVGAAHPPLGVQLQQVEQDTATQLVGDSEAQGDPTDGAGTLVVELREDGEVTPGRGQGDKETVTRAPMGAAPNLVDVLHPDAVVLGAPAALCPVPARRQHRGGRKGRAGRRGGVSVPPFPPSPLCPPRPSPPQLHLRLHLHGHRHRHVGRAGAVHAVGTPRGESGDMLRPPSPQHWAGDRGLSQCHLRSWSWKVMVSPMSSSPDTLSSMSTVT